MIRMNVHEAKTHLSRVLDQVARGEHVLLCKHNKPVAELHPVSAMRTSVRPVGLARHAFEVPAAFFEPLPADLLAAFGAEEGPARRAELASRAAGTGHEHATRLPSDRGRRRRR